MVAGNVGCDARMGSQRGYAENWCPEEDSYHLGLKLKNRHFLTLFQNDAPQKAPT
jgi:hypothetical protein